MPRVVRPVDFEDRLTLVEHLDELRSRIIVCLVVFGVALALCFWQNHLLLEVANGPLPDRLDEPSVFGVAEAFTTTLTISAYAALLLSLPVLLYELYAFVLPALSPREKKAVLPFLLLAPFLFVAGVVFAYFVVMPAALDFLLSFNDDEFNNFLRAREYYSHGPAAPGEGALSTEARVDGLAVTRLGIVTPAADRTQPPLRDPDHRGPGDAPARHRPDHDAALDDPAHLPVRGKPPARAGARRAGGGGPRARAGRRRRRGSLSTDLH